MKKKWVFAAVFAVCCAAALVFGQSCARGVSEGLALAAGSFIPATLPLYFLTAFLAASPLAEFCERPAAALCRLFGLPPEAAGAAVCGLIGGYPAAAIAARRLRENGALSDAAAAKAALCFAAPGPAFTVWAVGGKMLGSVKAGALLLASIWLANLVAARLIRRPAPLRLRRTAPLGWSAAFSGAVGSAAQSCLLAAASAGLFSGAAEVVLGFFGARAEAAAAFLLPLFEVTRGCAAAAGAGRYALPLTAAALGFGGLAVITQLCCFCEGFCGAKKIFLLCALKAALTAGFAALFGLAFKPEINAAAVEAVAAAHEFQISGALLLLVVAFALCLPGAVFHPEPLEFAPRGRYNYSRKGASR